jgi:trehalose utilization protein
VVARYDTVNKENKERAMAGLPVTFIDAFGKRAALRWQSAVVLFAIIGAVLGLAPNVGAAENATPPVRLVVWDEQQPQQKQAYENFLGNQIAESLKSRPGISLVKSVRLDDPEQGITDELLDQCDVLIWWGHVRNQEVRENVGRKIVDRIKAGKLALITLHSAHWSTPFMMAMDERATEDALAKLTPEQRKTATVRYTPPKPHIPPRRGDPLTPSFEITTDLQGKATVTITRPVCVFPAYRADAKPSHVRTLLRDHPIAAGVPETFDIPQTEMYDEPFHVPPPDQVVFEERWDAGEHFRSGCVWNVGKGKVFYFRPGHEIYPVYKQEVPLKILENAVRWLGAELPGKGQAEGAGKS